MRSKDTVPLLRTSLLHHHATSPSSVCFSHRSSSVSSDRISVRTHAPSINTGGCSKLRRNSRTFAHFAHFRSPARMIFVHRGSGDSAMESYLADYNQKREEHAKLERKRIRSVLLICRMFRSRQGPFQAQKCERRINPLQIDNFLQFSQMLNHGFIRCYESRSACTKGTRV